MTRTILIDTDPGLDDAIAILLALARPEWCVAGIMSVAGNLGLDVTTRNAGRLLALAGRGDVPLHVGADRPLARAARGEVAIHGADGLGGVALPDPILPTSDDAAEFLDRTLSEAPEGSVELLCLGPLTNLATLIEAAPEAARRLRSVVAMGGALAVAGNVGARSEFNLSHDPEAAASVLAAGLDLTLVPLDATRRVRADRAFVARLAAGPPVARACAALLDAYFAGREDAESRPLHDPLVPLLALRPDLFDIREHRLGIDPSDDPGALIPGAHRVRVAHDPDADTLLDLIATSLGA